MGLLISAHAVAGPRNFVLMERKEIGSGPPQLA